MNMYRFGPRTARTVITWLWGLFILIVTMILVGGVTRLTKSGLSITEWKPITGFIPPFSEADWLIEFQLYQNSPEYQLINKGISLSEFKPLFWMEFSHRLLGRFIGLYMLIPMIYFWGLGLLTNTIKRASIGLLCLIGIQGYMGWYMVESGLSTIPAVSPLRLAAHLSFAFIMLAVLMSLLFPRHHPPALNAKSVIWSFCNFILVCMGLFYGAIVAGLKAGLIYNTFPTMGGQWIPAEILDLVPWWRNFIENHATVQFTHRLLAFLILSSACLGTIKQWASPWYLCVVLLQLCLGIATLLYQVPVVMGVIHQGWAILVFSMAYWCHLMHWNSDEQQYI